MMVGIAAAILQRDGRILGVSYQHAMRGAKYAFLIAVPFLLLRQSDGKTASLLGQGFENMVVSIVAAGLILFLWNSTSERTAHLLAIQPFPYLGRISYGLYIFHLPCLVLASAWFSFLPVGTAVPALAMTVGIAALSWRYVEGPINAQKHRLPTRSIPGEGPPLGPLVPSGGP